MIELLKVQPSRERLFWKQYSWMLPHILPPGGLYGQEKVCPCTSRPVLVLQTEALDLDLPMLR